MNTNFEVKLIGYYVDSNMKPEKIFIEECEQLSKLFNESFTKTFGSIEIDSLDYDFKKSLTENSVYIFTDKENNKFAYHPSKNSVRITNVKISKENIIFAPLFIKSWFVLGERIDLILDSSQPPNKISKNGVDLYNLKKEKTNYKRFRVQPMGTDIIIIIDKQPSYPIDFDETISMKELYDLINSDYIYLQLYDVDDNCGDCDGYNYDNCDYSRCHNDCENCGGRKNICNNSCFNYRHKYALKLKLYPKFHQDITELKKSIKEKISKAHIVNIKDSQEKADWSSLLNKINHHNEKRILIDKYIESIYSNDSDINIEKEIKDYTLVYNSLWNDNKIEKVEVIFDTERYIFQASEIHVDYTTFLFFWDHHLFFHLRSFDFLQKRIFSIDKAFKMKDAPNYVALIKKGGIKRIALQKKGKEWSCELK